MQKDGRPSIIWRRELKRSGWYGANMKRTAKKVAADRKTMWAGRGFIPL